jgi:hypothetical protein
MLAEIQELHAAQQLRRCDHVLPSSLASSVGPKQLVWRNCVSGKWASLCCTTTAPETASVWGSLCAMDASSAADGDGVGLGLEWQEALPVVKRLRLQLRRLQQKGQQKKLDGAPQPPASSSAPKASCDASALRYDPPTSPPAEGPTPTASQLAAAPPTAPPTASQLAAAPLPLVAPPPLVRVLGPEERPTVLWGRGGLCGEEQPCGNTVPYGGARRAFYY